MLLANAGDCTVRLQLSLRRYVAPRHFETAGRSVLDSVYVARRLDEHFYKVALMRIQLVFCLFAFGVDCEAQDITVRPDVQPPPTTFASLQQLTGPLPSGPCTLPSISLAVDSLKPITLGDSASFMLPNGWQASELRPSDDGSVRTRLIAPGDSRILIDRELNGAISRHFIMYGNGERPEGATCSLPRGQAGAIWTFYAPNPQDASVRKYTALGSIITPAGSWYSVTVGASSAADQYQLASIVTEVMLRPSYVAPPAH
jgi:hypothetical protein